MIAIRVQLGISCARDPWTSRMVPCSRRTQSRGMWNAPESSFSPTFIFRRSREVLEATLRVDLHVP